MNIRPFLAVSLLLLLTHCAPRIEKPDPFLSKKQMIDVLTEMQLSETLIQQLQTRTVGIEPTIANTNAVYDELFEKYGLTKESMNANIRYYTYYSRDLQEICEGVLEKLTVMDSLERVKNEELIEQLKKEAREEADRRKKNNE